jgi:hypothetical protein
MRAIPGSSLPLRTACGMIAATEIKAAGNAAPLQGGFHETRSFWRSRVAAGHDGHRRDGAKQASAETRRHPPCCLLVKK